MKDLINITVRIMPSGDEYDVELSVFSTGKEIVEELISSDLVLRNDPEGNPFAYELKSKARGIKIEDHKTLNDLGIRDGETLFFAGKMVAG